MTPDRSATPLHELLQSAGAEFICYGPPPEEGGVAVAEHFGAYEAEYAAIRRHVGVLHRPQVGLIDLRGADVRDFLHRMVTQQIREMTGGQTQRTLQINHRGRIMADLLIHHGDQNTWAEMDVFDLPAVQALWESRLFTEDLVMQDVSAQWTAISLHGPAAQALLQKVCTEDVGEVSRLAGTHHVLPLAGAGVTVSRRDQCGVMGLHLYAPAEHAVALYQALMAAGGYELGGGADDPLADPRAAAEAAERRRGSLRARPIGWQALNTARIEAGTAIFHIDFGPDSIPAEAGEQVMTETVSFTKGCYLGQEIVARMKHLGHPKRLLVGLELPEGLLPVAGTQVFAAPKEGSALDPGAVIGGVTSSSLSPVLGQKPVVFAIVKWGHHRAGDAVLLGVEGQMVRAAVTELRFLKSLA